MENCLICRCDFDKESEITHCHQCVYKYHRDCLEKWFACSPMEKSFLCMVCKSDWDFDDTRSKWFFYSKLEKYFEYFRWIAIYTLFAFVGNVSASLYRHFSNYIILHYDGYISNTIQAHCVFNMGYLYFVYPVLCYVYDIIVFQNYLKRHYSADSIKDFRLIYYDCIKLITIGMTLLIFTSLVSDKKYDVFVFLQ